MDTVHAQDWMSWVVGVGDDMQTVCLTVFRNGMVLASVGFNEEQLSTLQKEIEKYRKLTKMAPTDAAARKH